MFFTVHQFSIYIFRNFPQVMTENLWTHHRQAYRKLCTLCELVDNDISKITLVSFSNNLYFICVQLLWSLKLSFGLQLYYNSNLINCDSDERFIERAITKFILHFLLSLSWQNPFATSTFPLLHHLHNHIFTIKRTKYLCSP